MDWNMGGGAGAGNMGGGGFNFDRLRQASGMHPRFGGMGQGGFGQGIMNRIQPYLDRIPEQYRTQINTAMQPYMGQLNNPMGGAQAPAPQATPAVAPQMPQTQMPQNFAAPQMPQGAQNWQSQVPSQYAGMIKKPMGNLY